VCNATKLAYGIPGYPTSSVADRPSSVVAPINCRNAPPWSMTSHSSSPIEELPRSTSIDCDAPRGVFSQAAAAGAPVTPSATRS